MNIAGVCTCTHTHTKVQCSLCCANEHAAATFYVWYDKLVSIPGFATIKFRGFLW